MATTVIRGVYFQPWIGKKYEAGIAPGVRLLLLGESHYSSNDEPRDFTIRLTQDYVDGKFSHRFWTNIMQVVDGRDHDEIDRAEFWARVAFYNFVQEIVSDRPGTPPKDCMLERAVRPFFCVLRHLRPSHVLVLGKRLWQSLPDTGCPGPALVVSAEKKRDTWRYCFNDNAKALATWLPHPSYGFSPRCWHPWVKRFLGCK
jgi:hypothetical protein